MLGTNKQTNNQSQLSKYCEFPAVSLNTLTENDLKSTRKSAFKILCSSLFFSSIDIHR